MNVVLKDGEQRCDLDVEIQNDAKFVPPSKVILKNVDNTSNAAENKSLINPRLIKIYLLSFVCATIYVGFPVVNSSGETSYWAYYLAKCQYWNFFGNAGFVEIIEAALPGAPLHIYVYAYIFGWGIPALFHVILYYAQVPQYLAINILLQASSLIVTVVLYGYWQLTSDDAEDNMLRYRLSATDDQVLHDMFNAVLDIDDAEALACDSSMGMTGIGGRTESQTFPTVNLNGDVNAAARQDSTSDERFISHSRAMWIRTKKRFKQEEQDALTEARRQRASIVDKSFSGSHNTTSIQKGSLIPFLTESRNPITANNGDFDRASCDTADRSSHLTQQSSCSTLYRAASGTSMDAFCDEGEYDEDYFSTMEDAQYAPNSLPMLCKYYEILPRFWYRKLGEGPGAHITSRYRKWHFMWATLFLIGWIAIFFMLMVRILVM